MDKWLERAWLVGSVFTIVVASLTFAGLVSNRAKAQDADGRWVREQLLSSCTFWGNCGQYFKRYHHYRRHQPVVTQRYEERRYEERRDDRREDARRAELRYYAAPHTAQCIDTAISRVGAEAYGTPVAKEKAEEAWMEEVRNRFGVRWMDLRNARRVSYECGRSSTGNRTSEKLADAGGKFLEQCTVEARPCRAQREDAGDEDEPVSRNLKEEPRGSRLFRRWRKQ